MLDDLAEFLKPREEKLKFGKVHLVVKELDGTADHSALKETEDAQWKILVRCIFREDSGQPAFEDKDIPALRKKSPVVTAPLVNAVNRVNGLSTEEEVKNSDAARG
jgi:hypothetical protein